MVSAVRGYVMTAGERDAHDIAVSESRSAAAKCCMRLFCGTEELFGLEGEGQGDPVRIVELLGPVKFRESVIDVELRQVDPGADVERSDVTVTRSERDEILKLNPFVVTENDAVGYQATSTLAGTRLEALGR